jgi:hypothetical protein
MTRVAVDQYRITTAAEPDVAAALVLKAWDAEHNRITTLLSRLTATIEDKGNRQYILTDRNMIIGVVVVDNGNGSTIATKTLSTRTTQYTYLAMPVSQKTIKANVLVKNMMRHLINALREIGCEGNGTVERVMLGK